MEFMTGVKEKETLELSELLEEGRLGEEVKVNGAVHTIRDMGTVAFVILRKREGLVQCVYEEGVTKFDLKDLREAATVEVTGKLRDNIAIHAFKDQLCLWVLDLKGTSERTSVCIFPTTVDDDQLRFSKLVHQHIPHILQVHVQRLTANR